MPNLGPIELLLLLLMWGLCAVVGLMIARSRGLRDIDGIAGGLILGFIGWLLLAIWPVKQSRRARQAAPVNPMTARSGPVQPAGVSGTAVPGWPGTQSTVPAPTGCPACGAPLVPAGRFCASCGHDVAARTCGRCGGALQPWAQFCQVCGTPAQTR